ncbi:VOC family protein [Solicola sp. PLA-1-18]|uniref:VOC family protein n=1 Tax=Solicola sp. PLA-1-18 TaxID=3380532 RepID=UPI003B7D53EA
MALARYKDLCIDVVDADAGSRFWAGAIGLSARPHDAGDTVVRLDGPTPQHGVWVNVVPEPVTVKQRVHLDLHTGSVGELEALGARVLPGWDTPWTVMADPDGGELCAFVRDEPPAGYRHYELGVDAADARVIARWWADVWGGTVTDEEEFSWVDGVAGMPFDGIAFAPVPEPRTVKNRIHWDVDVDDAAGVRALVDAGATVLREPDDDVSWTVMADPEGNEFCVFVAS